ncbi:MAG: toll/interleukin-1 receptor domain-containing protein, partial [Xanthomonadales bacterium]|nr:toll/interleukin-1 receptor domain-containing protein [Xanthomonadales bacterium]
GLPMSEFRYRAFISYCHQDEALAAWLHRALESYHVPWRLVGREGQFGSVPDKLTPVFRDREELSSATDLSEKITNALEESESLVVICSPASAQSYWVNEEIRQFRNLGRADRIFCFIVDGDPQSEIPGTACFPPALLEHEDGLNHEPLAADMRKWADGKHLAKLKLVAGILGIRLDKLCRRDLHRKRKLQVVASFAIAAVVTLAVFAFQKNLSEQQAREARQRDRENAEQMLSQFVEATESLEQTADLQTRKAFNDVASNFLQNLNPEDLTIESKRNLGKILQKQGETSYGEGHYQLAFNFFVESKAVLTSIYRENPRDQQAIFDLSQVEYYIGQLHFSQGRFEEAYNSWSAYRDASEKLVRIDPENVDWVMEMAYALSNLGLLERNRDPPDRQNALEFFQGALHYMEQAILLDESRRSEMADFHADLADARLDVCDLRGALSSRQQAAELAEQYYLAQPAKNNLKRMHAFTLAGLANVQQMTGAVEPALVNLQRSVDLLSQLYLEDRTRLQYRWNLLTKSGRAAHLMSLDGQLVKSWDWYLQLENQGQRLIEDDQEVTLRRTKEFAEFQIHFSETSFRNEEKQKSVDLLDEATQRLQTTLEANPQDHEAMALLVLADFNRWFQSDNMSAIDGATTVPMPDEGPGGLQSCNEIDLFVRQALMSGDLDSARGYSSLLQAKGYYDPEFMQLCANYDICDL